MFKQICIIIAIILLTLFITSCKTVEESHYADEVITTNELCKNSESHIQLYKAYKLSVEAGNSLYRSLLFYEECVIFDVPVLAKKIEKVFSVVASKGYMLEVWKIILNEDTDTDNNLTYYYIAKAVELTTENDLSA
mgnify:FL=1|tara:strand:- start:162 stop:569 length:408 start_codon:yes stop_codon:yes gene_type:complete